MPYYNVTPHTLFQSVLSANNSMFGYTVGDPLVTHKAWHEAVNIYECWKVVQIWFELIESGEAIHRYPDPFWKDEDHPEFTSLTQEVADKFISEMDEDFMVEKSRFQGRSAPEFERLPPHSRLAFVQELYGLIKSSVELQCMAEDSTEQGLELPPKDKSGW